MSYSTGLILASGTSLIYSIAQLLDLSRCDECEGEKVNSACQQVFYRYKDKSTFQPYIGNPMLADKEITLYKDLEISSKLTLTCENRELFFYIYVTFIAISCLTLGFAIIFKCCKLTKPLSYYKQRFKPNNSHQENRIGRANKKCPDHFPAPPAVNLCPIVNKKEDLPAESSPLSAIEKEWKSVKQRVSKIAEEEEKCTKQKKIKKNKKKSSRQFYEEDLTSLTFNK
jgi:hypothetical protein